MAKGSKILTSILVIIIGLLAVSTGYFYAQNSSLKKQTQSVTTTPEVPTPTITDTTAVQSGTTAQVSGDSATDTAQTGITGTTTTVTTTTQPSVSVSATSTTPATTGTTTTTVTPLKSGAAGTYTVKSGDSISGIATSLGVSMSSLISANGMTDTTANNIKIGQVLKVPQK
jgi:lysozyme